MRGHDTKASTTDRDLKTYAIKPILRLTVSLMVALGLAACGSSNGLTLGRVQGTVTYKGEPIRRGTVIFMPDESKGQQGPAAMGVIGNDGSYLMTTEQTGDGAVVGLHKVGIMALGETPISDPDDAATKEVDEAKAFFANKAALASPKTRAATRKTGPTYRDRSGRVFPILIPENLTKPTESGIAVKVERGANKVNIAIQENGTVRIEN